MSAIIGLMAVGILFIYSSSYHEAGNYETKQVLWLGAGFAAFMIVQWIGYRTFLNTSYLLYVISILLLVWVHFAGDIRYGAQRWMSIGPLVIQPSEFAKLSTILALANFLGSNYAEGKTNRTLLGALAMAFVPIALIVKQPDLGTALLFIPVAVVLLFIWGIKVRYIVGSAILGVLAAPLLWFSLKTYQQKRILVFLNPKLDPLGSGYTAMQSKIAVGSGGFWGKGFLHGTQSQLNFVPEHHTDFIFCVIGEEWGFLGALLVLGLYWILLRSILQMLEHTTDIRAKLLSAGVATLIFSQVFINIGMNIGLMPITGLPLPLVSYGGSSLVATMASLGLVLSVYRERSIF